MTKCDIYVFKILYINVKIIYEPKYYVPRIRCGCLHLKVIIDHAHA